MFWYIVGGIILLIIGVVAIIVYRGTIVLFDFISFHFLLAMTYVYGIFDT